MTSDPLTAGRCYCGATRIRVEAPPDCVTYCHCSDCRRLTGAPVAAFAGFPEDAITVLPDPGTTQPRPGVVRRFCPDCGSALTARFDYLPGQVYVPVGILDDADRFAPEGHAHFESCLPWVQLCDDLPKAHASARERLKGKA